MIKGVVLVLMLSSLLVIAEGLPKPEPLKKEDAKAFAEAFPTYEIDQDYADKKSTYSTKSVNNGRHYSGSFIILCSKGDYWVAWNGEQLASWNRAKDCRGFGETTKRVIEPIELKTNASVMLKVKDETFPNYLNEFWVAELDGSKLIDGKPIKYYVCSGTISVYSIFGDNDLNWLKNPKHYDRCVTDMDTLKIYNSLGKMKPTIESPYSVKAGDSIERVIFHFGRAKDDDTTTNGKTTLTTLFYEGGMTFRFENNKLKTWSNVK